MSDPKSTFMPDYVVGDSIAHMFVELNIVKAVDPVSPPADLKESIEDKYSKVGLQSQDVLARVERLVNDVPDLTDKRVVLSSGLTNIEISMGKYRDPDFASIEAQLKLLQEHHANISLMGVSNENPGLSKHNDKLEELAKKYGATFVKLPQTFAGDDFMHPHYWDLVDSAQKANASDHSIPELSQKDAAQLKELFRKVNAAGNEHYDLTSPYHEGANGVTLGVTGASIHTFEQKHGLNSPDKDALIKALKEAAGETQPATEIQPPQTPARPAQSGGKRQASGG